jgi:hypothetical protein
MKKELLNPRGYLSWTQVDLWLRKPEVYVRQYMFGAEGDNNARMAFGSKTALAIENGGNSGDELIDMLAVLIPKYEKHEHEIRADFKTEAGVVTLLGKLDTFSPKTFAFREYKTGTTKWTAARAQGHKQLLHYAALIWLKYKKVPEAHLDWAQTVMTDGVVSLTGEIKSFPVKITLADILEYLALVARVARDIDKRYRLEINEAICA